jgi:hypothetical protein
MRLGGKLMEALKTSGNKKLEGLWAGQKRKQIERRAEEQRESK